MKLRTALDVNASGLTEQRQLVEVSSANLANSQTTRTEEGGAYRRKDVVFQTASFQDSLGSAMTQGVQGVEVSGILDDSRPFDRRSDPRHPDADKEAYVSYPDVNAMEEMSTPAEASSSYD